MDGDHPGQRCRLAPCVDDNAGWTSVDLMLPLQCVKASLDQFGRKTLELFIWKFYFADGSVNTKSPDFREVMAVFSVGACEPEAFTATRAYAAAADDHHHLIPQTCCSRNHVIFWTSFFMDLWCLISYWRVVRFSSSIRYLVEVVPNWSAAVRVDLLVAAVFDS